MRIKPHAVLITVCLLLFGSCCTALCETAGEAVIVPEENWSWDRGAFNSFSGQIDLSDCAGNEVTVCISAGIPYNPKEEQDDMPVFTSLNGSRIVMTKQNDTVRFAPDPGNAVMTFSVSFRLPEKQRVQEVPLTFLVKDADGNVLKTVSARIGKEAGESGGSFYIAADINLITIIIAASAALVWILVLIRGLNEKKKKRTGE